MNGFVSEEPTKRRPEAGGGRIFSAQHLESDDLGAGACCATGITGSNHDVDLWEG